MITPSAQTSLTNARRYFREHLRVGDYYTEGESIEGVWFGEGAEQWQQCAAGIFRAVENGRPLVRSCNNGVTCWIDAHGRVRQIFKDATGRIYGPGFLTLELPLPAEKPAPTFYNRHGDWFGWGCVLWAVTITARRFFSARRD